MSIHSKVVWSEGQFLQPHHLQQQERYLERYVEGRCHDLTPYGWGFAEVELERDLLGIGKFALRRAAGVFPDGTPFRMPDDDPLPDPLEVGPQVREQTAFLAVPLRRGDSPTMERSAGPDALARYDVRQREVKDVSSKSGDAATVEVGELRTRFLLSGDLVEPYACVPLAHIVECRADKRVVLDDRFIPTVLRADRATPLAAFMSELAGALRQRGEKLASGIVATGRGGAAEIVEYLELQVINRLEPVVAHYARSGAVHPENLFRFCLGAIGELATFTADSNRPPGMPEYRHEKLRESFDPLMEALRELVARVIERRALSIPVAEREHGIRIAIVPDRSLFTSAAFILAARADVPAEELRRRFPAQLKIGPSEKIRDLVMLALPGIPVHAVPVAPRQIPYHAGFAYFELDQAHELWSQLSNAGHIVFHVGGQFPGLTLELWAIRG